MISDKFKEDYRFAYNEPFAGLKAYCRVIRNAWLRLMFWGRMCEHTHNKMLKFVGQFFLDRILRRYQCELSFNGNIGAGLLLLHMSGITINKRAKLGKYVILFKGATIGSVRVGNRAGCPTIGNRVVIGLNSTVVGNVKIGNNVMIAPNAFVNFDVPNNSLVIGNPGVIHHRDNPCKGYGYLIDESVD